MVDSTKEKEPLLKVEDLIVRALCNEKKPDAVEVEPGYSVSCLRVYEI